MKSSAFRATISLGILAIVLKLLALTQAPALDIAGNALLFGTVGMLLVVSLNHFTRTNP